MAFQIYWHRNDRTIAVHWTNKHKQKYTGNVIWHSINVNVIPLRGEEKENEQRGKQREKQRNKETSYQNKASCHGDILQPLPPPFPYFWRITFTPLSQVAKHFQNAIGLGWSVCSVRYTEQPQNCTPYFETSMEHLSLPYVGHQGPKVYHWTVRTTMYDEIVTQTVMVLLEMYLLNALLCHTILVLIFINQLWGTTRETKVASH